MPGLTVHFSADVVDAERVRERCRGCPREKRCAWFDRQLRRRELHLLRRPLVDPRRRGCRRRKPSSPPHAPKSAAMSRHAHDGLLPHRATYGATGESRQGAATVSGGGAGTPANWGRPGLSSRADAARESSAVEGRPHHRVSCRRQPDRPRGRARVAVERPEPRGRRRGRRLRRAGRGRRGDPAPGRGHRHPDATELRT